MNLKKMEKFFSVKRLINIVFVFIFVFFFFGEVERGESLCCYYGRNWGNELLGREVSRFEVEVLSWVLLLYYYCLKLDFLREMESGVDELRRIFENFNSVKFLFLVGLWLVMSIL